MFFPSFFICSSLSPTASALFRGAVVLLTGVARALSLAKSHPVPISWQQNPRSLCLRNSRGRRLFPTKNLSHDFDAHGSGGAANALDGRVYGRRVQVGHFLFRDLFHLLQRNFADFVLVRRARTLGNAGGALQQNRSWRRLGDEGEGAVVVNRNHDRNDQPLHLFLVGSGVELLAELHDVDLRLAQGRAHRRRRGRFAGGDLQLHVTCNFLCHVLSLLLNFLDRRSGDRRQREPHGRHQFLAHRIYGQAETLERVRAYHFHVARLSDHNVVSAGEAIRRDEHRNQIAFNGLALDRPKLHSPHGLKPQRLKSRSRNPAIGRACVDHGFNFWGRGRTRGIPDAQLRGENTHTSLSHFLHLVEFQLYRGRAAENCDHYFQRFAIFVHFVDHAGEAGERAFGDANRLVLLELDLELRLLAAVRHFVNDMLDFFFGERRGLLPGADKSSDTRRGLHHMPDVIVHVHFDQHVAGIEHALGGVLLAAAHFGDRLGRDQHLADLFLQPESGDA